MRASLTALLLLLLPVAGCQTPPPDAYVHGAVGAGKPAAQVSIGKNAVGEDCTQSASTGDSAAIYCGTWQEPSAHVRSGGAAGSAQLVQLATASPWRVAIDTRFRCEPPTATTILGGNPAELMQCTRLVGGWAHVAMVADGQRQGLVRRRRAARGPRHGALDRRAGRGRCEPDAAPVSSAADALLAQQAGGAGVQLGRCRAVR